MSCVVALKDHGSIYLASDSQITSGTSNYKSKSPKFHMLNKDDKLVWFAWTGRARFSQIAKKIPFTYQDAVRQKDVENWTISLKEHLPDDFKFTCLVVGNNSIFYFSEDRFVLEVDDDYTAIGSGAKFALGALDAMTDDIHPLSAVTTAVEIAIKRDCKCGGRIYTQIV